MNNSNIHLAEYGLQLGISKNKFVVKQYGKIVESTPEDQVKRIIIDSKGVLLSSDVIQKCSQQNIPIDFIDYNANPYASLITFSASLAQNTLKQVEILNTNRHLELAKSFIKGKAKNQVNYIKYLEKYHKKLSDDIEVMENLLRNMKYKAKDINSLLGYEGNISSAYWKALKKVLNEDIAFEKRDRRGATDLFNMSLNYSYAILYGKVQSNLVKAGLSLHVSYLHSLNSSKPTLVYDFIEEFRTFIVDRVIISLFNRKEKITLDPHGLLNKQSRQLIAKNIYEKFDSYTTYREEKRKVEDIIEIQAYKLFNAINNSKTYHPFIGKY